MNAATVLAAYAAERYPARLFVPLAGFLAAAGLAGGGAPGPLDAAAAAALAYLLVFQFRLWDDLADREMDRAEHPTRITARRDPAPLIGLAMAAGALNGVLVALRGGPARLGALALLAALLLAWYRWRPAGPGWMLLGAQVVLLKYAVIVYLVSPPAPAAYPAHLGLAALQVLLCFGVYEILHDRRVAAAPGAPAVLAIEMVLLVALSALAWRMLAAGPAAVVYGATALAGAVVLATLFRAPRPAGGVAAYAVFALIFPLLLILSLGGAP